MNMQERLFALKADAAEDPELSPAAKKQYIDEASRHAETYSEMSTKQSAAEPTYTDRVNEIMIFHGYAEPQRHVAEAMYLCFQTYGEAPPFTRGGFPCILGETSGGFCPGRGFGPPIPGEDTTCPTKTNLAIDHIIQKANIVANRRFQQKRCPECGKIFDQMRKEHEAIKKAQDEAARAEAAKARARAHTDRTLTGVSDSLGSLAVRPALNEQESEARQAQAAQAAREMEFTFGSVPRPPPTAASASSSSSSAPTYAAALNLGMPAIAARKK